MTEYQELTVGRVLTDSSVDGSYTFSLENSDLTFVSSRADLANNPTGEVQAALETFGYDPSEFTVEFSTTSPTSPIRFEIRYTDFTNPEFLNVNLPNITIEDNLTRDGAVVDGEVSSLNISPVNADGSINGAAVPFNIDFSNRFTGGTDVYGFLPEGDFNDTDGFIAVGAVANGAGLSIQENTGQPLPTDQPFESFSVRVFLDSTVTAVDPINVAIEVPDQATEFDEYLLLFSEQGRIDPSLVQLEQASQIQLITNINAINTPPVSGAPLSLTLSEDDATTTLDLTQGSIDADGDTLTVVDGSVVFTGNTAGVSVAGNILTVNPAAYAATLNAGRLRADHR